MTDGEPDSQPTSERAAVTRILSQGDAGAAALLPLVYAQLRAIAQQRLAGERSGHTLQATALVHEACLKLVGPRDLPWQGRGHFYAAAAEAMRRILIDHARSRGRRGGEPRRLTDLGNVAVLAESGSEQVVAVDAAVRRSESEDPEAAAVVRLRFYAGLSVSQAAEALGISERTTARQWTYARATMYRWLSEGL